MQTKKIKSLGKRIIAILVALLLLITLCTSDSNAAGDYQAKNLINKKNTLTNAYVLQNEFGGSTYNSIAFDFHIFAEDVVLNAHTNGNIATYNLTANYNAFGADEKNHLQKREDNYIGFSASGITNIASNGYIVIGAPVTTKLNFQDKRITLGKSQNPLDQSTSSRIYQETKESLPYVNISNELAQLREISKTLSYKPTSPDVSLDLPSHGFQTLTVNNSGGNHYLNLEASALEDNNGKRTLNIALPNKTTLIINVDMKNANITALKNLVVNLNNYPNGEAVVSNYCGLLWNLYDSSRPDRQYVPHNYAQVGMSDYFFGTILAPSACITYGAVNGSIIAKKTKQGCQESHRFDFTGYEDPANDSTTECTTEASTDASTEITTETSTEKRTTEISTEKPTTEVSTEISTEKPTTEVSTEISTEIPTTEITTEISTEKPTTEVSTEISTEIPTTEVSTEISTEIPTTEITTEISTEKPTTEVSTEISTEIPTTEISTEITTEIPTTEVSTESTTEKPTTEGTTEISTETPTTEVSTEKPTTEVSTESTTQKPTTEVIRRITTQKPTTEITTTTIRRHQRHTTEQPTTGRCSEKTPTTQPQKDTSHQVRTGDASNIFLWSILGIMSLGLCITFFICKLKK